MQWAKFNSDGTLLYIASNAPGIDTAGLIKVADNADPNNLFLYGDGTAGPRTEVVINSNRTVIRNDGEDTAMLSGLPKGCTILVNGEAKVVSGTTFEVTTTASFVNIDLTGAYYGARVIIRGASADELMNEVRVARDALLAASDWTQMADAPLDETKKGQWASYRNALRNITTDQPHATIDTVIWPTKPV